MSVLDSTMSKTKKDPSAAPDGRKFSSAISTGEGTLAVESLKDADEALSFL